MNKLYTFSLFLLPGITAFFLFYNIEITESSANAPLVDYSVAVTDSIPENSLAQASILQENQAAEAPFVCAPNFYQTISSSGILVRYNTFDFAEGFDTITTLGFKVNATAYNPADDYVYAVAASNKHLIRIHGDGSYMDLGDVGLTIAPNVGEFDPNGNYYVKRSEIISVVDIENLSSVNISANMSFGALDWAYNYTDDKFYGVGGDKIYHFDAATNTVAFETLTGLDEDDGNSYGAAFYTVDGYIYVSNNSSGNIYRLDLETNEASFVIQGPSGLSTNDGAGCPFALPPFPVIYANNDTLCVPPTGTLTTSLFVNDSTYFSSLNNASFEIITEPAQGTVTFDEQTGEITYTAAGTPAEDNFRYRICGNDVQQTCDAAFVTVRLAAASEVSAQICEGDIYYLDDTGYTETGTYLQTYTAFNGCDSIVTLNLTVLDTAQTDLLIDLCNGESYSVGNSTYTASGNYVDVLTASNGCDSTINLTLTVLPIFTTNLTETICNGESYSVGNSTYTTSGNYVDVLTASNGCDSTVNLALTVLPTFTTNLTETICDGESYSVGNSTYTASGNYVDVLTASNGCDSTVNLALTVLPTFTTNLTETICDGESYSVGTSTYTASGNYVDVLTASNGCDSTINLTLTVLPTFTTNLTETICDGESYSVGNSTYTTSGNYVDVLTAANGCDSTINLTLTVLPTFTTDLTITICDDESYIVGSSIYTVSGNYTDVLPAANGCDSTVNLTLTVLPTHDTALEITICDNETYTVGTSVYNQTGSYTDLLTAENGCDSTVNLVLSVLPTFTTDLTETICEGESYSVGSSSYTASGNYIDVLTASNGCDSTVNLNLTVLPVFSADLTETICSNENFTVGSSVYTEAGNYTDVLSAQNGCDSVVNLALTVLPVFDTQLTETVCDGEQITVGTSVYTEPGIYTDILQAANGCDSTVTLSLNVLPLFVTDLTETICDNETFTVGTSNYNASGNYVDVLTAANGCDSTVNLTLTVLPTAATTLTETICDGDNFAVGSNVYTTSGTYENTFTAANGCDSTVTLQLTVLPVFSTALTPTVCAGEVYTVGEQDFTQQGTYTVILPAENGCDSTITLNLTVLPNAFTELNEIICDETSYSVGNSTYTESGVYTDVLPAANGCDSTVTLNLTVLENDFTPLAETICAGESVAVGNSTYTETGIYLDTLSADNGCNNVVELNLTVLPVYQTDLELTFCEGEYVVYNGSLFNNSGNFTYNFTAENGCDSIVDLTITELFGSYEQREVTLCAGETYTVGEETVDATGYYNFTMPAANGCDSIVEVALQVNPVYDLTQNITICPGETTTVGAENLTEAGVYEIALQTAAGCDSLLTVNLTVADEAQTQLAGVICEGETYQVGTWLYSVAGTYSEVLTTAEGCDSIVELTLDVLPTVYAQIDAQVCAGESYLFGIQNLTETGVYEQTFASVITGCDSIVTLTLEVDPMPITELTETVCAGETYTIADGEFSTTGDYTVVLSSENGCDSIVNLALTVLPAAGNETTATICGGETYTVGSSVYDATGIYENILQTADGCDSLVTLDLTILPVQITNIDEVICAGESINIGSGTYTETGMYTEILTAQNGCDSTVNLTLTVLTGQSLDLTETICAGESVVYGDQTFSEAGQYEFELISSDGCTGQYSLDLTVLPTASESITAAVCEGESYFIGSESFTATGNYEIILQSQNGCDSIVDLDLTVNALEVFNLTESICAGESYQLGTETFTAAGEYQVEINTDTGCPEIYNLSLSVTTAESENITAELCAGESYTVGAETFNQSGDYEIVLESEAGCDSLVNLNLTVFSDEITDLTAAICAGEFYELGDQTFTETGIYQVDVVSETGCPGVFNLTLNVADSTNEEITAELCAGETFTVEEETFTETGIYEITLTNTHGCDSLVTLDLLVHTVQTSDLAATICHGEEYVLQDDIFDETGNYTVEYTAENGCPAVYNLDLTVAEEISENIDMQICAGETVQVGTETFDETGAYTVLIGSETSCDSIVHLNLTVEEVLTADIEETLCAGESITVGEESFTETGLYQINLPAQNGCDSLVNLDLTVNEVTQPTVSGITEICDGTSTQLSVDIPTGHTVLWSTGATGATVTIEAAGDYTVTLSVGECTATDTVTVTETTPPTPEILTQTLPSACGETDGVIEVTSEITEGVLYSIDNGENWQDSSVFTDLGIGVYEVMTAYGSEACTAAYPEAIEFSAADLPYEINLSDDNNLVICGNGSATLDAGNTGATYEWESNNGFTGSGAQIEVTQAGIYSVTVTNAAGCVAVDEIPVEFTEDEIEANLLIPREGVIDRPIVAVDISWPIPDSIVWEYDTDAAEFVSNDENQLELRFPEVGAYEVTMHAYRGDCVVTITKQVEIFADAAELTNPENIQPGFTQAVEFNIYPNPSSGQFYSHIVLSDESFVSVYIYNEQGDLIEQRELSGALYYREAFDISGVPPGVYAILLQTSSDLKYFNFVVY